MSKFSTFDIEGDGPIVYRVEFLPYKVDEMRVFYPPKRYIGAGEYRVENGALVFYDDEEKVATFAAGAWLAVTREGLADDMEGE